MVNSKKLDEPEFSMIKSKIKNTVDILIAALSQQKRITIIQVNKEIMEEEECGQKSKLRLSITRMQRMRPEEREE
jgi:ABC-type thiamine transport system ATPase subunit